MIFDEADPDAELDQEEDELDEPIPEEDEEAESEFLPSVTLNYSESDNQLTSKAS